MDSSKLGLGFRSAVRGRSIIGGHSGSQSQFRISITWRNLGRPGPKAAGTVDANTAVQAIESGAADWLVSQALAKLVVAYPVLAGWASGPIGWLLGIAAWVFIHYADILGYMFIDGWQTSHEAGNYENAAKAAADNPNDAQARADQEAAFRNLFG